LLSLNSNVRSGWFLRDFRYFRRTSVWKFSLLWGKSRCGDRRAKSDHRYCGRFRRHPAGIYIAVEKRGAFL